MRATINNESTTTERTSSEATLMCACACVCVCVCVGRGGARIHNTGAKYLAVADIITGTRISYTMGCLHVRGDNPRALASGLSYVQVDKHVIIILYRLHLCRLYT